MPDVRAKLCQRQHDFPRIRDPVPALKAAIFTLKQELQDSLEIYYELLLSVLPQLEPLALAPGEPELDKITLPSRFTPGEVERFGLAQLLEVETDVRIAHAYQCINELKNAIGSRSFWGRHFSAQLKTQTKKTKGQASLLAANARVKDAMRMYKVCWSWLMKIAPEKAMKFGLRQLNDSDVLLLSDWQEAQGYKRRNDRLPWIWTLKPHPIISTRNEEADASSTNEPQTKMAQTIEAWRTECRSFSASN